MLLRDFKDIEEEAVTLPGIEGVMTKNAFIDHEALPGFNVRLYELSPGGHTTLHWHRQQHIYHVLAGEGEFVGQDEERTPIRAGNVLVVPSLDPHMLVNTSNDQDLRLFDVVGPCSYAPE
jgi:oxalate decarboxylase/phosphoglucose isomerase-like protein (cupin superfamily)